MTSLITGANRGIGLEIARQLSQRGHHVLMGVRHPKTAEAARQQVAQAGGKATLISLDVADDVSVQAAYQDVQQNDTQLDVLINNAGILINEGSTLLDAPMTEVEQTLQVNALGVLRMVQVFRPLLKRGSRIINVSSGAGAITEGVSSYAPVYSLSKAVLNVITMHLAREMAREGIPVNAAGPGWVRTDMGGSGAPRSVQQGADTPVWLATEADVSLSGKFWRDRKEVLW